MHHGEKIKLAELIRNNLDLPVIATFDRGNDDNLPYTGPVIKCGIQDYAERGNGRLVMRKPFTEQFASEDDWKPAIFVYLED